jgi:23S rRNA (guanosine2251-2'-O)-methyltransferase
MEKRRYKPLRDKPFSKGPKGNSVAGIHPVSELLKSDKEVERVLITKELLSRQEGIQILTQCRQRKVPCQSVPIEKLNRISSKVHQGVIAFVGLIQYQEIGHILPFIFEEGKTPFFLVLDRITDVRNFGAIARTAECAGVQAIIVPDKGAAQINEDAMKTSAGALHHIPVCREKDLARTLDFLSDSGVRLIACTEKGEESLFRTDFSGPVAIIMGSEEDGISDALLRKAHHLVSIPQAGKIGSLNVSVAAGIALFEAMKQRTLEKQ